MTENTEKDGTAPLPRAREEISGDACRGESRLPLEMEQGPIRPPSEAGSLLLRITRNCPWNRCRFCHIYKGAGFSPRPLEEVLSEIDALAEAVERIRGISWRMGDAGEMTRGVALAVLSEARQSAGNVMRVAAFWLFNGGRTVFLQDANSLVTPPGRLAGILEHLRRRLPSVDRITSYTRSHTLARMAEPDLRDLRRAGLDRVHVGMESGHDPLLRLVDKGVTAEQHVEGGRKAMSAGLELSAYIMPGLGGKEMWRGHAEDSASVLRRINPHFIRLRTAVIQPRHDLYTDLRDNRWTPLDDDGAAREIRLLLERLDGCGPSRLTSDHIINLLPGVAGKLPEDRPSLIAAVDRYLSLPSDQRLLYRVGRRGGIFSGIDDLDNPILRKRAANLQQELEKTHGDADTGLRDFLARYI